MHVFTPGLAYLLLARARHGQYLALPQLLWAPRQTFRPGLRKHDHGLVFKAHRHVYHSTLGSRVIKKKRGNTIMDNEHLYAP